MTVSLYYGQVNRLVETYLAEKMEITTCQQRQDYFEELRDLFVPYCPKLFGSVEVRGYDLCELVCMCVDCCVIKSDFIEKT